MKKALRDKWVKALRSRKYKQGTGALEYDGKFCCLGVLCKVAEIQFDDGDADLDASDVTREFRDDVGLGANKGENIQSLLVSMNDDDLRKFGYIANWIEKNVPVTE